MITFTPIKKTTASINPPTKIRISPITCDRFLWESVPFFEAVEAVIGILVFIVGDRIDFYCNPRMLRDCIQFWIIAPAGTTQQIVPAESGHKKHDCI